MRLDMTDLNQNKKAQRVNRHCPASAGALTDSQMLDYLLSSDHCLVNCWLTGNRIYVHNRRDLQKAIESKNTERRHETHD